METDDEGGEDSDDREKKMKITYTLRRRRMRSMNITVRPSGEVIVSASPLVPRLLIERFVTKKSSWIHEKLAYFAAHPVSAYSLILHKRDRREYKILKEKALTILTERLEYFNQRYNFKYKNNCKVFLQPNNIGIAEKNG